MVEPDDDAPVDQRYVFAEPSDGCFIPRAANPDRSRRILEHAADWYGGAFKVDPDPDQP
jgi:hypothetical protein